MTDDNKDLVPLSDLFKKKKPTESEEGTDSNLSSEDIVRQIVGNHNVPDIVPLGKIQELIDSLTPVPQKEKPKNVWDYYKDFVKTEVGIADNAVSMALSGAITEPLVGILGSVKLMTSGRKAKKETIEPLQEYLDDIFSPKTKYGREVGEKVALGAEFLIEPFIKSYHEWISQPAGKYVSEKVGINAGAAVEAGLETLPQAIDAISGSRRARAIRDRIVKRIPYRMKRLRNWYTYYTPTVTERGARAKAATIFINNFRRTPIAVKNMSEAKYLERQFPGLKFDITGTFEEPVSTRFVKAMKQRFPRAAEVLRDRLESRNLNAIHKKLRSIKPLDSPDRVVGALMFERGRIESLTSLEKGLRREMIHEKRGISSSLDEFLPSSDVSKKVFDEAGSDKYVQAGKDLKEALRASEDNSRKFSSQLFEDIPIDNVNKIQMRTTVEKIMEIMEPKSKAEKPGSNIPNEIITFVHNMQQDGYEITAQDLQKARSDILRSVRDMERSSGERNRNAERRMYQMIEAIDDAMRNTEFSPGTTAEMFELARKFHFEEVVNKFENPLVSGLHKKEIEMAYVSDAEAAGHFFKPGKEGIEAARVFKGAFQSDAFKPIDYRNPHYEGAIEAMKSWIHNDLIDKVYDFKNDSINTKDLTEWLNKYKYALIELELDNEFSDLIRIQNEIDKGMALKDSFDKSVAGRILDADIGREIDVIRNSKTPAKDARDLMNILNDDKRAIRGAQRSFIEQLEMLNPSNVKELDDLFKKNEHVYRELFLGEDRMKLKTMHDFRRSYVKLLQGTDLPASFEKMSSVFEDFFAQRPGSSTLVGAFKNIMMRLGPDIGKFKIREVLLKATLDPDFAEELRLIGKKQLPSRTAERRILKYMSSVIPTSLFVKYFNEGDEE